MLDQVNSGQQAGDVSLWAVFFGCLIAAMAGEAWRADLEHLSSTEIARRVVFRSCAAAIVAACTLMLAIGWGAPMYVAGAAAGLVAVAGADVALATYLAAINKRLGIKRDGKGRE